MAGAHKRSSKSGPVQRRRKPRFVSTPLLERVFLGRFPLISWYWDVSRKQRWPQETRREPEGVGLPTRLLQTRSDASGTC